jgi:hypothetical protein
MGSILGATKYFLATLGDFFEKLRTFDLSGDYMDCHNILIKGIPKYRVFIVLFNEAIDFYQINIFYYVH